MFEVAAETGWQHDAILDLPVNAGFYYALLATRAKADRVEGQRLAATFAWMDEKERKQIASRIHLVLCGPGHIPTFEETLTASQREALKKSEAELDAVLAEIQERNLAVDPEGKSDIKRFLKRGG